VPSEKNTRGLLRSVVDRNLNKSRVVIFDSLNNLKGYRYELYCIAKAAATRYCMVHVDTPAEISKEWNSNRKGNRNGGSDGGSGNDKYCEVIFDDLAGRFERPDARNRWDAPLFTVSPMRGEEHVVEQVSAVAVAATESSLAAAVAAAVAAGASAAAPAGKDLTSNLATASNTLSGNYRLFPICDVIENFLLFVNKQPRKI
jgi:protein KTI12